MGKRSDCRVASRVTFPAREAGEIVQYIWLQSLLMENVPFVMADW